MLLPPRLVLLSLAALLAVPFGIAHADVIDGDWCYAGNRHLTIKGPRIVTPAGTETTGDYNRHHFTYVVPASDPGAGTTVVMDLLNETTMALRAGAAAEVSASGGQPEIWKRCAPAVSSLGQDGLG